MRQIKGGICTLQIIVRVLKRFVILFVSFILGGVAGFCFLAHFRTLLATLVFVILIILFAFILYVDVRDDIERHPWHIIGNSLSFLAGGVAGFALLWYALGSWWAIP